MNALKRWVRMKWNRLKERHNLDSIIGRIFCILIVLGLLAVLVNTQCGCAQAADDPNEPTYRSVVPGAPCWPGYRVGGLYEQLPPMNATQRRAMAWERVAAYGYWIMAAGLIATVICGIMFVRSAMAPQWLEYGGITVVVAGIGGLWAVYCQWIIYGCAAAIAGLIGWFIYKAHRAASLKAALTETVKTVDAIKGKPWDGATKKLVDALQSEATKEVVKTLRAPAASKPQPTT